MATTVFYLSGTTLTTPVNYIDATAQWHGIGAGAGGSSNAGYGSGGGGEYRRQDAPGLAANTSYACAIAAGGPGGPAGAENNGTNGGDTTLDTNKLIAKGGLRQGGLGGTGGTGSTANNNGGRGKSKTLSGACGGGGAGGPNGAGGDGGDATSTGGSGGGAANGGTNGVNASTSSGTNGGNNRLGAGAGSGTATGAPPSAPGPASNGGGGGGVGQDTGATFGTQPNGGTGSMDAIWTQTSNSATAGPGSGGGAPGNMPNGTETAGQGGAGGLYGGGGADSGPCGTTNKAAKAGDGANGILVLIYNPSTIALGDYTLDNGLLGLDANADKMFICASMPTSYADATSGANSLGSKNWGAGAVFGSPAARAGGGRQITSIAITDGAVSANGTVGCWAAVDSANSRLLASGPLSGGKAVTSGQVFTLSALTIGIPNA